MSWLARSIANSLKLDDDEEFGKPEQKPENPDHSDDDVASPRGMKEDLSGLRKTLTSQFWGVASFLAPPPAPKPTPESEETEPDPDSVSGMRTDLAEFGGKFRTGISKLSNNINVSEITKMASSLLQLGPDDEDEVERKSEGFVGAVGVTEEVVVFARDVALHPGTWLDFPLPESDDVDFVLSDCQQEHALAVERLAPGLAALRMELCPGYMSESLFWKIYFVLLHPKLDKQDAELLSTPQILKTRASLMPELKNQPTAEADDSGKKYESSSSCHEEPSLIVPANESNKASDLEMRTSIAGAASQTQDHQADSDKNQSADKSVTEEKDTGHATDQTLRSGSSNVTGQKDEDDADDWLKEADSEISGANRITMPIENDDDVSFSDLEEDDGDVPLSHRKSNYSSGKDSRDWVQLGETSSGSSMDMDAKHKKESSDWLDLDDIDAA